MATNSMRYSNSHWLWDAKIYPRFKSLVSGKQNAGILIAQ